MSVGTEIRRRRKAFKWTLEELAKRVDSDTGNLSRVETGKQGASEETLRKIAGALGCSVADLFAGAEGAGSVSSATTLINARRIPLINDVQVGDRSPSVVNEPADWLLTDLSLSPGAFALRIDGESMLPEFRDGDVVVIDPAIMPRPGDFVVARSSQYGVTFRKYRPRGPNANGEEVVELAPLNEDYPSVRSDITAITLVGTMVEHRRYRRP
ncbi:MAG: LexA family transcriptional regulator [Thermoanaerobaculia bacterium]|nr:LexA family transcriptional regulator [Thermoanaerobaculia bacterium]